MNNTLLNAFGLVFLALVASTTASCFVSNTTTLAYDSYVYHGCRYAGTTGRLLQITAPNQDDFRFAVLSDATFSAWDKTSGSWSSLNCVNSNCQNTYSSGQSFQFTGTGTMWVVVFNWNTRFSGAGTYKINIWDWDRQTDYCSIELCASNPGTSCHLSQPTCSSGYATVVTQNVDLTTNYCVSPSCYGSSTPSGSGYTPYYYSTPSAGGNPVDPGTTPVTSASNSLSHAVALILALCVIFV